MGEGGGAQNHWSVPRTLFEKVWDDHVIHDFGAGDYLLHVDRHWLNDAAYHALAGLERRQLTVRNPELTFAVVDHLLDTRAGRSYESGTEHAALWARGIQEGCERHGIEFIDIADPRHGISHVISPELGLTLPGSLLVCTDSHTCTNGAFGAYACGFGSSGGTHVLATQTLIARRPKTMRVIFEGNPDPAAAPKDLVLHMIGCHGVTGGLGHALEYAGGAVVQMSMESRMTICNMAAEFGAATAMVAPDEKTFEFLEGRSLAPTAATWNQAVDYWRTLASDPDAHFDRELSIDCEGLPPQVTWGTNPGQVTAVDSSVLELSDAADAGQRRSWKRAMEYMDLEPGQPLAGLPIDGAFIGSCTNARLDDLRAAAAFLHGRTVAEDVRALCVPGSATVKRAAEAEGLDHVFREAGFAWGEAGCALCMAAVIDGPAPGSRMISSTNRSSEGRQGPGVRAHLASPATVAASAVAGQIVDIRSSR
jgi:3-isopropylmalate/(R)-2-methylmalate dehydratase large subunit